MARNCRILVIAVLATLAGQAVVGANEVSARLRQRAADELFSLDEARALDSYRAAIAADPDDAAAHRGLASALLVRLNMQRGTMTIDSYLGRVNRRDVALPPPPADIAREFRGAIDRAIGIARRQVDARPRDAQAHYELGAAVAIRASYSATIEGGVLSAFRAAREAYNEHEAVLRLAPARADAGLIIGMYRYVVAALSMPMRWMAYVAGFGGGRELGLSLVERAAGYAGENRPEAQLAAVVLYTREQRYDDALRHLRDLLAQHPRNRLLALEHGSLLLRARRPAEADRVLTEGLQLLPGDPRPRMFGEEVFWYFRRGSARAALGRTAEARVDFMRALDSPGRPWVHGRVHTELGRLALDAGDRAEARRHLELAVQLGDSDRDGAAAGRARALLQRTATPR